MILELDRPRFEYWHRYLYNVNGGGQKSSSEKQMINLITKKLRNKDDYKIIFYDSICIFWDSKMAYEY